MHGRGVGAAEAADLRGERNVCAAILKLAIRHLSEARGGDYTSARDFFESRRLDFHCGVLDLDAEAVRQSAREIIDRRGLASHGR